MISTKELRAIARARLRDAEVLLRSKRFDGAFYLCGYAIELALKVRICRTLKWSGFPESGQDFKGLQSVKTHDLAILPPVFGNRESSKSKTNAGMVCGAPLESRKTLSGESLVEREGSSGYVKCVERLLKVQ
jgi:hypothetical protein